MPRLHNGLINNVINDLEAWVDITLISSSDGTKCGDGRGDRGEAK